MKLNLLPKTVSKNVQSKTMFFVALAAVAASLVGAWMFNKSLQGTLESYKEEARGLDANAQKVRDTAKHADDIISQASVVLTNANLVRQIDSANVAYPDLYDNVKRHLPSFFRLRTMQAVSAGPEQANVTLTGYLKTFQQYSDIMISLLRMDEVVSVSRAGFSPVQAGNEGPFNYNADTPDRGAIPGWSEVTINLVVAKNLQAPDARETLQAAAPGGGGGNQAPGGAPGGRQAPTPGGGGPGGRTGGPTPGRGGSGAN
ncbi:MAG: hypothetical protein U0R49_08295 [Fimbriimonadales bacterium]